MTTECLLCETVEVNNQPVLCSYCYPDSCVNCHVDDVHYDDGEFKCSHGCTYDIHEYVTRKLYTVILNGSWQDKLALAGKRVEYIIPNTDEITVYSEPPQSVAEGAVLGTHYTDSQELIETGDYCPEGYDGAERFDGTLREDAAYAWPFPPEYTEEQFEWNREYVVFEVPQEEVYVSSYRFIDWVADTDAKYTVPVSKYKAELTFTPEQLRTVCRERNRPAQLEDLF